MGATIITLLIISIKNGQSNILLETHFKEANGKTEDTMER